MIIVRDTLGECANVVDALYSYFNVWNVFSAIFNAPSQADSLSPGDISLITGNVIRMSIVSSRAVEMKYSARNWMKR